MDSACSADDCNQPIYSRARKWGFCVTHYRRDYHQRTKDVRKKIVKALV